MTRRKLNAKIKRNKWMMALISVGASASAQQFMPEGSWMPALTDAALVNVILLSGVLGVWSMFHILAAKLR